MIPRGSAERRAPSAIQPRDRSGNLPAWTPTTPLGDWTPATAWAAAEGYADAHDGGRGTARAAYRALLVAVPDLHRADIEARLRGAVDDHPRAAGTAAAGAEASDPAPF